MRIPLALLLVCFTNCNGTHRFDGGVEANLKPELLGVPLLYADGLTLHTAPATMPELCQLFSDTRRTVPEDLGQIDGGALTGGLARTSSLSLVADGAAVEYEGLDLQPLNDAAASQVSPVCVFLDGGGWASPCPVRRSASTDHLVRSM